MSFKRYSNICWRIIEMNDFIFALDTKSYFFNIENDNDKGHTATVATVLKQGSSVNPALPLFQNASSNIPTFPDGLLRECTKNSKSVVKITNILVFDKIYLNGKKLDIDSEFCIYLKQEIDPTRIQFGRIKLHYPLSLKFSDYQYNIDNRKVMDSISSELHDYAFLVAKFQLFQKSGKINIITTLIGPNSIPYSKVFLNYKGDATQKFSKVFNEIADNYEIEAPLMRKYGIPGIEIIDPSSYLQAYNYCKFKAVSIFVEKQLNGCEDIQIHSDYPYDVCDVEAIENGTKHYFYICFTATNQDYFFLSRDKNNLIWDFEEDSFVILVKNVLSELPIVERYSAKDIQDMSKEIEVLKYRK